MKYYQLMSPHFAFFFIIAALSFSREYWQAKTASSVVISADEQRAYLAVMADENPEENETQRVARMQSRLIDEKLLLQEAVMLNLHHDAMIEARLQRKLKALWTSGLANPTREVLQTYYAKHPQQFMTPKRRDLEIAVLNKAQDQVVSTKEWKHMSQYDVAIRFGTFAAEALEHLATEQWSGPITSPSADIKIKVLSVEEPRLKTFDEAKNEVASEWRKSEESRLIQAKMEELHLKYAVTLEPLNHGQ